MPLTFVSHQAPVLPLKLVAPKWFDGTALALGSMAPDLAFALRGTGADLDGHGFWALLWFGVPATVLLTIVTKRLVAGPLGPHLPDLGQLHLKDYARLAAWRLPASLRGWAVLLASAWIGAYSHVVLDAFTHSYGWAPRRIDALRAKLLVLPDLLTGKTLYLHDLLQIGGTVVGAAVTLWCLAYIGRHRLLREWYPASLTLRATSASARWLWGCTAAGAAMGIGVAAAMWHVGRPQHAILRWAGMTFAGLVVGCLTAQHAMTEAPLPADESGGGATSTPRAAGSPDH